MTPLCARSWHMDGCCMSDPTDPLAWVQRAEADWLLARSALRRKAPLIYGTTFHAQQRVEKDLKALLMLCRAVVSLPSSPTVICNASRRSRSSHGCYEGRVIQRLWPMQPSMFPTNNRQGEANRSITLHMVVCRGLSF